MVTTATAVPLVVRFRPPPASFGSPSALHHREARDPPRVGHGAPGPPVGGRVGCGGREDGPVTQDGPVASQGSPSTAGASTGSAHSDDTSAIATSWPDATSLVASWRPDTARLLGHRRRVVTPQQLR